MLLILLNFLEISSTIFFQYFSINRYVVSRHVKVSQPGSHGLAHHEPGSK